MLKLFTMKKIFKQLLSITLLAATIVSCKKDEVKSYFEGGTAPVLTLSSTAPLVLKIANKDNQALALSWTNPNYQFSSGISSQDVSYILQIDTVGANFTNPKKGEKSIAKELSTTLTVKDLNTILLGMGLVENIPHNIEMRVKANITNSNVPLFSNVSKVVITPYLDVVYPVPAKLYITGSATPASWMSGGDPENVNQRFTKVGSSKFEITIALTGGNSFLLIPVYGDWSNKYGFTGGNNANNVTGDDFKPDGGDLKAPAASGTYKITVDFKTGKYSVQ
jgi:starch-binding outer membrane protein SusE/F